MDSALSFRNRSLLRELLATSFRCSAEAAAQICAQIREVLDVDVAYASAVSDGHLELLAVRGLDLPGMEAGARWPLMETFCGRALAGAGPAWTADLVDGPCADVPARVELGMRSFAMTPLWDAAGQATGSLAVLHRQPRSFSEEELALLEMLGGVLSREQELDRVRARETARAADLAASESRYRSLVDDLGDIVVEADALGRITYVNRAFTELSGFSAEQTVGGDMMNNVHPEDRALAAEHIAVALSGADTGAAEAAREVRFLAPDGSVRWMSVRGRSVLDEGGQLAGFRGILHDVTARVQAEQQVRAALAEAEAARDESERASRAKSDFLSRMSHELRTPLNAILGFGQLLELGDLSAEDEENVEQIIRAGRHLLDLINEVLDVVRVESGALSLSIEPVEVGDVVAESLDLVRTSAAQRAISMRTPDRFDGALVLADRQRLKQILVNLLSNAVKYNRDAGEVVVTWTVHHQAPAGTDTPAPEGWLRLAVRDTGSGIPANRIEDVFTPFDRLGAETSGIEGTGVGLSLTKTLVEAIGGRIGVASELGTGSTFWVDLPAAARPCPAADADDDARAGLMRTVLYIEDNPSNITLVRKVLARRPHVKLVVIQDGAEGVEAAASLLPDLVLLDLHLPGMHGGGILTTLRGADDERLRKVPIIVVTADLTVGNERRMLEAGATMFLPKPIDVRQLLAVVDDHLPLS